MGDVLRQRNLPAVHECAPPVYEATYRPPAPSTPNAPAPRPFTQTKVDGDHGDLWRCHDCGRLWRVGWACDACDYRPGPHGGMHTVGCVWRPARFWQRLRYRRYGKPA
jgi:hypothetical protein